LAASGRGGLRKKKCKGHLLDPVRWKKIKYGGAQGSRTSKWRKAKEEQRIRNRFLEGCEIRASAKN